jgi:rfaE bifunctional protein kinase chain/domain
MMTTSEILARFRNLKALVVGDVCLDRWCTYDPAAAEPSRETGIPRVAVIGAEITPGAGGTVASNLAALGCGRVAVLGVVGADGFGWELRQALRARGIDDELLVTAPDASTFTYTKFWNRETGAEDLPRADFINAAPVHPAVEHRLYSTLKRVAPEFDVILVSDQAESGTGEVVTGPLRQLLSSLEDKIVWADSRLRIEQFRNVIAKPNAREAAEACSRLLIACDYAALRRHIGKRPLIVTHGGSGAEVVEDSGVTRVPTRDIANPVDICGAGDSFSAAGALAFAITGSAVEAAKIGNLAASVTIMKRGTGTASPEEILAAEAP